MLTQLVSHAHPTEPPPLTGWTALGIALVAAATVLGAWLGRRASRHSGTLLAGAAGVLVAIAAAHLLPDAARLAWETWVPVWAVGLAALLGYLGVGVAVRHGCPCDPGWGGGAWASGALALHRAVEGSALAITASVPVVVALVAHAMAEGLAMTSLLTAERPRRLVWWVAVAAVSPVLGAVALSLLDPDPRVLPIGYGLVAGVLLRAAWIAFTLAGGRPAAAGGWVPAGRTAATALLAGAATTATVLFTS